MNESIDIEAIFKCLPHRYPFLLVDRVLEWEADNHLIAIKNVTVNEPFFQGHFPGRPIMQGVLMLEAMAQACGILSYCSYPPAQGKELQFLFAGVDNARFKRVVVPGDQLKIEVTKMGKKRNIWRMNGKVTVGDALACSADLLSAVQEVDK